VFAAQSAHQVVHAEGRVDPAGDGGAALFHRGARQAAAVDRDVHQEARLHVLRAFLHQRDPAGDGRRAAVARRLHRRAPHRLAEHVVAEGAQVAAFEGLDVGNRGDEVARTGRLDLVVAAKPAARIAATGGREPRRRDDGGDPERLDAGKALDQAAGP
jgi:hypothetical protein